MPHASRARLQAGIRGGHVILNGNQAKVAAGVRPGDVILIALPEPPPMAAVPEVGQCPQMNSGYMARG